MLYFTSTFQSDRCSIWFCRAMPRSLKALCSSRKMKNGSTSSSSAHRSRCVIFHDSRLSYSRFFLLGSYRHLSVGILVCALSSRRSSASRHRSGTQKLHVHMPNSCRCRSKDDDIMTSPMPSAVVADLNGFWFVSPLFDVYFLSFCVQQQRAMRSIIWESQYNYKEGQN